MAKEEFKELKKSWRSISFYDRLSSLIYKTPATFGEYSQAYSDFVIKVVEEGECLGVDKYGYYLMFIFKGSRVDFSLGNFPFAYGNIRQEYGKFDYSSNPNWKAVLKLREKQLEYKEEYLSRWLQEREV